MWNLEGLHYLQQLSYSWQICRGFFSVASTLSNSQCIFLVWVVCWSISNEYRKYQCSAISWIFKEPPVASFSIFWIWEPLVLVLWENKSKWKNHKFWLFRKPWKTHDFFYERTNKFTASNLIFKILRTNVRYTKTEFLSTALGNIRNHLDNYWGSVPVLGCS